MLILSSCFVNSDEPAFDDWRLLVTDTAQSLIFGIFGLTLQQPHSQMIKRKINSYELFHIPTHYAERFLLCFSKSFIFPSRALEGVDLENGRLLQFCQLASCDGVDDVTLKANRSRSRLPGKMFVQFLHQANSKWRSLLFLYSILNKMFCYSGCHPYRVVELGSLSSGAKMAMKIFVKRVFTIFASNASFLRVIAKLQN